MPDITKSAEKATDNKKTTEKATEKVKKPFPKIVISKERRDEIEKFKNEVEGICLKFRAGGISMNATSLKEFAIHYATSAENKENFVNYVRMNKTKGKISL